MNPSPTPPESSQAHTLYRTAIRPVVWAHVRRARVHLFLIALLDTLAILTGSILVLALLDRLIPLPAIARQCAIAVVACLAAARALLAAPTLLHRPDLTRAAAAIERAGKLPPESLDTIVAAFENPNATVTSLPLLTELARQTADRLARIPTPRVPASLYAPLLRAALPLFVIGALLLLTPVAALTAGARVLTPWLESNFTVARILVSPGETSLRQGQSLTVVATLDAPPPEGVRTLVETSYDNGVTWTGQPMTPRGPAAFVATLDRIERDLRYRVRSGATLSSESTARIVTSPFIRRATLTLSGPTGTSTRELRGIPLDLPPFDKATLVVTTVEPLAVARLYAPGLIRTLTRDARDPTRCTVELERSALLSTQPLDTDPATPPQSPTSTSMDLRLELVGARGSVGWASFRVTLLQDRLPALALSIPALPRGQTTALAIRPGDDLLLRVTATDDIGLKELHLTSPLSLPILLPRSRPRRWDELVLLPADAATTVSVTDTLGQTSASTATANLTDLAPDLLTIQRAAALSDAGRRVVSLRRSLEDVSAALERVSPAASTQRSRTDAAARARTAVSSATESLARFDRSLLISLRLADLPPAAPAIASAYHHNARFDIALEACVRAAAADESARPAALEEAASALAAARGSLRDLEAFLVTLRRGDSAAIALAAIDPSEPLALPEEDAGFTEYDADALARLITSARRVTLPSLPASRGDALPSPLHAALAARTRQTTLIRTDAGQIAPTTQSVTPAMYLRADAALVALIDVWANAPADRAIDLVEDLSAFDRLCEDLRTRSPDLAALVADAGLPARSALLARNASSAATAAARFRSDLAALAAAKSRPRPRLNPTLFLPAAAPEPSTRPSQLTDLSTVAPQYRQAVHDYFDLLGLSPATQPAN